jgi:hypothetical protein
LLYIGLVNGSVLIRSSQDTFHSAIVMDHRDVAHTAVVRQVLPCSTSNGTAQGAGIEFLSCGDDGRVVHNAVFM